MQQELIKNSLFKADIPLFIYRISPFSIIYISDILVQKWSFCIHTLLNDPDRIREVIYEEDRPAFIKKVIDDPLSHCDEIIEFRMTIGHDILKWYGLRLYPIQLSDQIHGIIGCIEDITDRKEQEINLQQTYDKFEDSIRMIKHDLKGMVGSIKIIANLIREKISAKEQEELVSYFELISMICQETVSLTEEFSGRYLATENLEKEDVNLAEEVFHAVDLHRAQLEYKKLTMKVLLSEGKMTLQADKMKCWQIIKNLISNAIKFSYEDGQIIIVLKELKDVILLEVCDTGIGIPSAFRPFIYQKHSQAMRNGTKGEKPTGMGTYIVKKMVEAHKGEVWFESEEGKGTTFFVKLPK